MKTIVIAEDGTLIEQTTAGYLAAVEAVGPEGFNTIQLTRNLCGFVNDVGLVSGDYRRNPVGGLVLIALGAARIPYAGPVVLTGWDGSATYRDEPEVRGLTPLQCLTVRTLHGMVVAGYEQPGSMPGDEYEDLVAAHRLIVDGGLPPVTFGPVL